MYVQSPQPNCTLLYLHSRTAPCCTCTACRPAVPHLVLPRLHTVLVAPNRVHPGHVRLARQPLHARRREAAAVRHALAAATSPTEPAGGCRRARDLQPRRSADVRSATSVAARCCGCAGSRAILPLPHPRRPNHGRPHASCLKPCPAARAPPPNHPPIHPQRGTHLKPVCRELCVVDRHLPAQDAGLATPRVEVNAALRVQCACVEGVILGW